MPKMSDHEEYLDSTMVDTNDIVVLLTAGEFVEPMEGSTIKKPRFQIRVQLQDQRKKTWTVNKTSRKRFVKAWGDDSENWIDKNVRIEITTQMVQGTMRDVLWGYPTDEAQKTAIPGEQQQLAISKAEEEAEDHVSIVVNDILNAKSDMTPKNINDLIIEKQTAMKTINLTQLQAVTLVATDLGLYKNGKLVS